MTERQHIKTPSEMLLELVELSNPTSEEPQHFTDLANQGNALFLMRQGSKAVIGYFVSQWPSYAARRDFYREMNALGGLISEGVIRTESTAVGEGIEFCLKDRAEPSVTTTFVPLHGAPAFNVSEGDDRGIPLPGQAIATITVSLEAVVRERVVPPLLDAIARFQARNAILPYTFRVDHDSLYFQSQPKEFWISLSKQPLDIQRKYINLMVDLRESRNEHVKQDSSDAVPLFQEPLLLEALRGIEGRYTGSTYYTEPQKPNSSKASSENKPAQV